MQYRNKHEKQKDMRKVCESLTNQKSCILEGFLDTFGKLLTVKQSELCLKANKQCHIRSDIITSEINQRFKHMDIGRRLTVEKVNARILAETDQALGFQTPSTAFTSQIGCPPQHQKNCSQPNFQVTSEMEAIKFGLACEGEQKQIEISKKDFKTMIYQRVGKVARKMQKDRPQNFPDPEELVSMQSQNDIESVFVKSQIQTVNSQALVAPSNLDSQQSKKQVKGIRSDHSQDTSTSTSTGCQKLNQQLRSPKLTKSKSSEELIRMEGHQRLVQSTKIDSHFICGGGKIQSKVSDYHQKTTTNNEGEAAKEKKRLETIIEPPQDSQISEPEDKIINSSDANFFQFLEEEPQVQVEDQYCFDRSTVLRDISIMHRQNVRESHELFSTCIQSESSCRDSSDKKECPLDVINHLSQKSNFFQKKSFQKKV